jgi:hypothetical protein
VLFYILLYCYHNTILILSSDLLPSCRALQVIVAILLLVRWSTMVVLRILGMREIGIVVAYVQYNARTDVRETSVAVREL